MTINEHLTRFAGLPVVDFEPSTHALAEPPTRLPAGPSGVAWRLSTDYEGGADAFAERLSAFLATPWAGQVRALVVGDWGESFDTTFPIERFVAAASVLESLTAIFIGEMTSEENEISWTQSTDLTPLLAAYPGLRTLRARGGEGLLIQPDRYPELRELVFEAGGLSATAVAGVWLGIALTAIRASGVPLLNLDLIYGIGGQTLSTWDYSSRKPCAGGRIRSIPIRCTYGR